MSNISSFHPTGSRVSVLAKLFDILRRRHLVNSSWGFGGVARSIHHVASQRLSACKYFSQNWLQGLPRRDLRHQIFYNEGSPATFSMFYTTLKMASISHETYGALYHCSNCSMFKLSSHQPSSYLSYYGHIIMSSKTSKSMLQLITCLTLTS